MTDEPEDGTDPAATQPDVQTDGAADVPSDGPVDDGADVGDAAQSEASLAGSRQRAREAPKRKSWARRLELPILIVVAIGIAIIVKTFIAQPFYIPSDSMEQTLHGCPTCRGDRILVFKPVFDFRSPHPGDIVVFKNPDTWQEQSSEQPPTLSSNPIVHVVQRFGQLVGVVPPSEQDLVKRVIAVGGQTVKCCDANGNLQVSDNGGKTYRSLHETYVYQNLPLNAGSGSDGREFGPVTIPKGRLWVMGDHRTDSADSLYQYRHVTNSDVTAASVSVDNVIGKAVAIAWPPSRWRTLGTPSTFASAMGAPGIPAAPVTPPTIAAASVLVVGGLWRRRR